MIHDCYICGRRLGLTTNHYVIRRRNVICGHCVTGGKHLNELHALAAPDCLVDWHDQWDHSSELMHASTREAATWWLDQRRMEAGR